MYKVGVLYRDASNYKFYPEIKVIGELLAQNKIAAGAEDVHITQLGLTKKEWRDPKYRSGYKWLKDDDHYLVDIVSVEKIED